MALLEVKNLHTYFKTRKGIVKAVNDVSYSLEPGKTIGIVGESGCGKSVTSMSVMRLLQGPQGQIYSGSIRFKARDFKRDKDGIPARVATIEYDPNRSANIALLHYVDGEKRYIIAPDTLKVGDMLMSGEGADIRPGNALPISAIPLGTMLLASFLGSSTDKVLQLCLKLKISVEYF